jgi:hypothetical protein
MLGKRAISKNEKPAAISRAGSATYLDDVTLPVICPTCQTLEKCGGKQFKKRNGRRELRARNKMARCGSPA